MVASILTACFFSSGRSMAANRGNTDKDGEEKPVYEKRQTIFASILLHMAKNLIAVLSIGLLI